MPQRIVGRGQAALAAVVFLLMGAAMLPAGSKAADGSAQKSDRCKAGQFRAVLDVGHTAEEPGAMSARGVSEYAFNLALARRMEKKLIDAGFASTVFLVTGGRAQPGLVKRVQRANELKADLFLSVHHDSVPERLKEKWEHDGKDYRFSDRFKGHSIFVSYDHADLKGSMLFARLLGERMKGRGLAFSPHYTESIMGLRRRELVDADAGVYRFDMLHVLRATRMPAVLLEAGLIVNREEELLLASSDHQSLIGAAVSDAVENFCAERGRSPSASVRRRAKTSAN